MRRLRGYPAAVRELTERGIELGLLAGETASQHENRIGTRLMALFRDSRSEDVFEALYAFAEPAVLDWIRGLLRSGLRHLDPKELLQDTFVNVYRYPGGFRDEHAGSFRVWVRTIAGNIVRRGRTRHAGALSMQELPEGLREPADTRHDPQQSAVAGEQCANLRSAWLLFLAHYQAAYDELSPRDREALHLVEIEGRSYAEAGEILRVGPSNMKMIIFRSRKRILARMRAAMLLSQPPKLRLAG
jgi:RNA polymerase sigma factor (sigma-70 family)